MAVICSLIITTHDRYSIVTRLIDLVLSWKILGLEIIIVDDTLNATIEAGKYSGHSDFHYIWAPGVKGPAESRNLGVSIAKGDRVIFLDDDDLPVREWLLINTNKMPEGVLFSNYIRSENGVLRNVILDVVSPKSQLVVNRIPIGAFSVSRNVFERFRFDWSLQSHEDWDYLLGVQKNAPLVYLKNHYACIINVADNGRNLTSRVNHYFDYMQIYKRYFSENSDVVNGREKTLAMLRNKGGQVC
jgi:glycosyltransferase involved in cell wall biosynthesis